MLIAYVVSAIIVATAPAEHQVVRMTIATISDLYRRCINLVIDLREYE